MIYFVTLHPEMTRMLIMMLLTVCALGARAQETETTEESEAGNPTFVPTVKVSKVLRDGDSIQYMEMSNVYVYPPNDKAKQEHMKRVEQSIVKEYKPKMKKLTYSQGKLLIKLINRECNSTSYEAIQAFLGPIRAGFWQAFAWAFGASLKKEYDPEGTDRLTERVVLLVEAGQL